MKTKIYTLLIVTGLFLAACAPAAVMEAEPWSPETATEELCTRTYSSAGSYFSAH